MVHYYTQKGWRPSDVYNAPEGEKTFLFASMMLEIEEKNNLMCPLFSK
jgi:hypothetical protein